MRRRAPLVALVLAGVLAVCTQAAAISEQLRAETEDAGVLTTKYLVDAVCRIYDNGDGTVTLYGKSVSNQVVDRIWVKVTLQKWTGSSWVDVNSGYRLDRYNTWIAEIFKEQPIQRGYYYRCKGEHQVIHDGYYDPNPPVVHYTDALWIQ